MNAIQISFYLRANQIRAFAEALQCIGSSKRICFFDLCGRTDAAYASTQKQGFPIP